MKRSLSISARILSILFSVLLVPAASMSSASTERNAGDGIKATAVETFLADISQNVTGDRVKISALLPIGADPHTFQPTPGDVGMVAESNVLIVNGAGLEEYLYVFLKNIPGGRKIIDASAGLDFRAPPVSKSSGSGEKDYFQKAADEPRKNQGNHDEEGNKNGDPHFWLSAANVVRYIENIRKGMSEADPVGAETYAANARAYTMKVMELDKWISEQVRQIPESNRLLVTDHDEFGYFADRYGFRIIGMIVPSFSTEASPSAAQIAELVKTVRKTGARAIFLEAGEAPKLAEQIGNESGIKVVTGLYTHSLSKPDGPAPNYIEMMRYNTMAIVNALKQ